MRKTLLLVLSLFFLTSTNSHAQDAIVDDAFDPFADYSDFVEATTEETDINFFKFGRMLSVGAQLGLRNFTGELGGIVDNSQFYGGFFTYYLGIQSAVQVSYTTGTHSSVLVVDEIDKKFDGTMNLSVASLHGKYFLNTQNFTKAISRFNPYFIGGFSQINRRVTNYETAGIGGDSSGSFDIGVGAEYIFNSRRNFISFQLMYYKTDFPGEERFIRVIHEEGTEKFFDTDQKLAGDMVTFSIMLGINY